KVPDGTGGDPFGQVGFQATARLASASVKSPPSARGRSQGDPCSRRGAWVCAIAAMRTVQAPPHHCRSACRIQGRTWPRQEAGCRTGRRRRRTGLRTPDRTLLEAGSRARTADTSSENLSLGGKGERVDRGRGANFREWSFMFPTLGRTVPEAEGADAAVLV